jgi:diguanylate cyclase (GGDEF)-like protein
VLDRISYETMALIGAECCEIEVLVPDMFATELLSQVMVEDWTGQTSGPGLRLPLAQWPTTRHVLETRMPLILDPETPSLTEIERNGLFAHGTESGLVSPMVLEGRAFGIISFFSRQPAAFTKDHVRMAVEFGSLAALAIDRVRTHMALSEQATVDSLTGLLNRRAILDRLDHQIAIGERTNDAVSVLVIDLNGFKHVNDTYGHLAGDAVLIEIARFLKHAMRPSDLVGRYGGDEFLAVLPHTDIVQAISVRDRLQEQVSELTIELADGSIIVPSFAVGFAAYPAQGQTRTALIELADRVMYEAKPGANGAGSGRPASFPVAEVA